MSFQEHVWWHIHSLPILLAHCWQVLLSILPFLAAGILTGELLKFTSWTRIIYKWASRSPFVAVLAAALAGMASPLCTFGTVPVLIELYKSGVHIAPLVAFLAASSLMNPQLFVMTLGGLGLELAVALVISVLAVSLALGLCVYFVPARYIIRAGIALRDDGGYGIISREKKLFIAGQYLKNCGRMFKRIGFYVLIGIFLGAVIELYIPSVWIHNALGRQQGVRAVLFAAVLGVPLFFCGGGAIPLANAMIINGMAKGSALAFFIVGSATRPAPLAAMAVLFKPAFLLGYCLFLIAASVLIGVIYV